MTRNYCTAAVSPVGGFGGVAEEPNWYAPRLDVRVVPAMSTLYGEASEYHIVVFANRVKLS